MRVAAPADKRFRRARVTPARRSRFLQFTWIKAARAAVLLALGLYGAYRVTVLVLNAQALTITRIPVEQHDEFMQYVLGLSHLVSILFFTALVESGLTFEALEPMASTTFHKQTRAAASVAGENPQLYYEIQKLNRHSAELFEKLRAILDRIEQAVKAGDSRAFRGIIEQGRDYFPPVLPQELD